MCYDPTGPESIRPLRWTNPEVFYFDGDMALIWGHYDGDPEATMGMRWMEAEGPQGYPVSRGFPQWMVVPARLSRYLLEGLERDEAINEEVSQSIRNRDILARARARVGLNP